MSEDWLDIGEREGEGGHLPAVIALPDDYAARFQLAESCWSRLTEKQRVYLAAWRDCRFNARAANRMLGYSEKTQFNYTWMQQPDYATVARIWRANAAADALDRDRLLARQDDIVETLLTPKPILHQGAPTGFEEVEASAAARANETLLQAAGVLKSKDEVNVNVGIVGPALNIQVMPLPPSKNAEQQGTEVDLPPIDAEFEEWPSAPSAP